MGPGDGTGAKKKGEHLARERRPPEGCNSEEREAEKEEWHLGGDEAGPKEEGRMSRVPFAEKEVAHAATFHSGAGERYRPGPRGRSAETNATCRRGQSRSSRAQSRRSFTFFAIGNVERVGVVRRSVPAAAILRPEENPA